MVVVAVAVASSLPTNPVVAHDHEEPSSVLIVQGERQYPRWIDSYWVTRWPFGDRGCTVVHSDGRPGPYFPAPMSVRAGPTDVVLRFFTRHRPRDVIVRTWRVEPGLLPVAPDRPEVMLVRKKRGGLTFAWDAVYRELLVGDSYIEVIAVWRDRQGCGGREWFRVTFHLRGLM